MGFAWEDYLVGFFGAFVLWIVTVMIAYERFILGGIIGGVGLSLVFFWYVSSYLGYEFRKNYMRNLRKRT